MQIRRKGDPGNRFQDFDVTSSTKDGVQVARVRCAPGQEGKGGEMQKAKVKNRVHERG